MTLNWQKDPPDEEGDWLWIEQFSCSCCLIKYGIAAARYEEGWGQIEYEVNGRTMSVSWEGHPPTTRENDGSLAIHWWAKIELPEFRKDVPL